LSTCSLLSDYSYFFFFFFFHDTAPPAIYTFPYTTLFRSRRSRSIALCRAVETSHAAGFAGPPSPGHCSSAAAYASCSGRETAGRDRKSTRLNSSHDQISYAVFCLKKKKKKIKRNKHKNTR